MGSGMMARLMFSARGTWMMTEMRPCWASCYIEIEMSIVCDHLAANVEDGPTRNCNPAPYSEPVV